MAFSIPAMLKRASELFLAGQYTEALRYYSLVLQEDPASQSAYNGAILADMAMGGENNADALFEYYLLLKSEDPEGADAIITEILESMDGSLDHISEVFGKQLIQRLSYEDGILYQEFKELIKNGENFKQIFENIMFSTRVIITEREDFVDFLENLIRYGYQEMALGYLENALSIYPNDRQLRNLLRHLAQGSDIVH